MNSQKEAAGHVEEVGRIQFAYAERDRVLAGSSKRDPANAGNRWRMREHREQLQRILEERFDRPLSECRILDVGCGYGSLLAWYRALGVPSANLVGVDLLPKR